MEYVARGIPNHAPAPDVAPIAHRGSKGHDFVGEAPRKGGLPLLAEDRKAARITRRGIADTAVTELGVG